MKTTLRWSVIPIYCRYREVSPVCLGKNRPLLAHEATKEHLIPKSLLRDPKIKAKLSISFNPSQLPNIDISCRRCNHLKNNLADVPFVWKLQYFKRYGISLVSKSKLEKSIDWGNVGLKDKGARDRILTCMYKGDVAKINREECIIQLQKMEIKLVKGVLVEFSDKKEKLPRKMKKLVH